MKYKLAAQYLRRRAMAGIKMISQAGKLQPNKNTHIKYMYTR